MLADTNPPQYLLRMGSHAERFYFEWANSLYDALLLNANLVEGTPAACLSLIEKLVNKPYVIDPISHAFALPTSYLQSTKVNKRTGEETLSTKRTFQKLAERYGEPFVSAAGNRPVTPSDFTNPTIRSRSVENILLYQRSRLEEEQPQSGPLRVPTEQVRPKVLLAPYFFMNQSMAWYPTNLALANDALALGIGLPIYAVVFVDRTLLQDMTTLELVAKGFCDMKVDGFFFWVSDQIEHNIGIQEVANSIHFVKILCSDGRPVYNMYGGYFSALLSGFGMTGFSHGVGYGEHRNVTPVVGGGVPPAKYYLPPIHQTFVFTDVQTILSGLSTANYYSEICNCPVCQSVIGNDFQSNFQKYGEMEFKGVGNAGQLVFIQAPNSVRICRGHYLAARFLEIQRSRSTDTASLIKQLRDAEQQYRQSSGFPATGYLLTWANGIESQLPT